MKKSIYTILFLIICVIFNNTNSSIPVFNAYSRGYDNSEDEFCKYKIYSNPSYRVILRYPKKWIPDINYGSIDNLPLRYYGEDGFFALNAANGDLGLEEIIKNEAYHKLQPYGSSPKIEKVDFKGSEGAFIFPSDDQQISMKGQAAFIVKYPKNIRISNNEYKYLILYGDKNNIKKITETLILLK